MGEYSVRRLTTFLIDDAPAETRHPTGLLVSLGKRAAVYARSEWPDDDLAAL
jgi:hypothetical protein